MRSSRRIVTLRDVARESGVSITTVSRILNGRASGVPIRDETRQRVIAAAAELGYHPNLFARGLRGSRSSLLGVILRDVSDPFHIQILRGVNEIAHQRDYRLFLGHVDYRAEVAVTYGSMFERFHADGLLVIGDLEGGEAVLDVLARQHHSIVGVSDRAGQRLIPGVYGDSATGTRMALEHLWSLGHRRIACVSDQQTHDGRRRIDGYRAFMRDHRAGAEEVHVVDSPGSPEPALMLGRSMFSEERGTASATGVYATSDTIAIGLMQAAFEAGLSIPRDLSVVGYDDIAMAMYTIPPLTTVSQDGAEMGRVAAGMLMDLITLDGRRGPVEDVTLAPHLIVRRSTAPPTPVRELARASA